MNNIELAKLMPTSTMRGEDDVETALLRKMLSEAEEYVRSFSWCGGVVESYLGIGVGGIISIFLFKITPASSNVDEWLWIIVGDVPPAYITIDCAPNPACALDAYIGAMQKWISAVRNGESIENLIPVNVSPTNENANSLETRLNFLDEKILSKYSSDLKNDI